MEYFKEVSPVRSIWERRQITFENADQGRRLVAISSFFRPALRAAQAFELEDRCGDMVTYCMRVCRV